MSSNTEQTLQIKQFPGIDRASDGTNTPANRFLEIQNMHPVGPGELASLGGVSDLNSTAMPGVGKIIGTRFMRDAYNNPLLLAFYRPDAALADWTPAVVAGDFTNSGTAVATRTLYVVYVGPGGYTKGKSITPSFANATTITFTVPTGASAPPSWVAQIDIYSGGSDQMLRMASMRRRSTGAFRTSVTFSNVFDEPTDASVTTNPVIFAPDRISSAHIGGSSPRYERWYFGVAPNFYHATNKPIAAMINSAASYSALTSDVEVQNGTTITLEWALAKPGFSSNHRFRIGDFDILRVLPFAGRTPEDLVLCASPTINDVSNDTSILLNIFEYSITGDFAGGLTHTAVTGTLNSGDRVLYMTNGGSVTGLTTNTKYYIKIYSSGPALMAFYASFDDYLTDTKIAVTYVSGTPKLFKLSATFTVKEDSLYNSRNNVQMIETVASGTAPYRNFDYDRPQATPTGYAAVALRTEGVFTNNQMTLGLSSRSFLGGASAHDTLSGATHYGDFPYEIEDIVGCWVLRASPFSLADAHQLLPGVNERSLSQSSISLLGDNQVGQIGYNAFFNPTRLNNDDDESISSSQFRNRVFTANGDNILWYTNGYMWKPTMRSDGKAQIPQSRYVQSFNERLVAAGGKEAVQNSDNVFYYSEIETPFDWGTTINSYSVFSKGEINGLGVYSQNLVDTGFAHFLAISKKDSIFVWNGSTSRGPQQIYYAFGFAGPKAFAVTDTGPVFVSRDNVWLINGDKIQDIGDEVADILSGLTDAQLAKVNCTYHDRILKIGYPGGAGTDPDCDREIWMEFRTENGQLNKYISGPHVMKAYYDQDSALVFDGEEQVRVSSYTTKLYQRDTGLTNDGSSIAMKLVLSRLGLKKDHLRKLLNKVYIAVKVTADETATLTLNCEDGTSQYSASKTVDFDVASRQLFQWLMTQRFSGRINKLTLEITTPRAVSIYDLSLLFKVQKRGTLRYGA